MVVVLTVSAEVGFVVASVLVGMDLTHTTRCSRILYTITPYYRAVTTGGPGKV